MNDRICRYPLVLAALALAGALTVVGCNPQTPQSLIESGKQRMAKKEYSAALVQFKSALQMDPASAEARYLVGKSLLDTGDPANAAIELAKASDQKFQPDLVMPALARALLLSGEFKKLTTLYGDVTLDDKQAEAALKCELAKAWGVQGDRAKTEAAVAAALAASPDFGPALVLKASLMAGRGEFDPALATVNEILAKDDSLYDGWMLKGELLLTAKNDRAGADAAFNKVLTLESAYVPAHVALISSRLVQRDVAGAKQQAAKLRAVLPGHPQTLFVDAVLAYSEKDFAKSKDILQQLLRLIPDNLMALQLAGVVEGHLNSFVLAENYLSKALTLDPNQAGARVNLARVQIAVGQPTKALEVLAPLLSGKTVNSEASAVAGDALLRLGDAAGAEAQFIRAARLNPDDVRSSTSAALARMSRGDAGAGLEALVALAGKSSETYPDLALIAARLKRAEYTAALEALDALEKKAPNDAKTFELRGRIFLAMNNHAAARGAFEQALKIEPGFYSATANLVELDLLQKQPDQAVKRVEARMAADPRNHHFGLLLASIRERAGAPLDELRTVLTQAVKAAPTATEPRLRLIDLLLRKRQLKEALTVAEEASSAFPNDANVMEAVGRAYMEAGDPERAINSFRKLAGLMPESPLPYVRLAAAYRAISKPDMAETAMKKALDADPNSAAVQRNWLDLLLANKREAEALKFALELQRKSPDRADGYGFEADVRMRLNQPDAAIAALRKGVAAAKGQTNLPQLLYVIQLKTGRTADADRHAAEWLKAHPDDTAFETEVGEVAIARGNLPQAEGHLKSIVGRQPNNANALNNLAWVLVLQGKPGAAAYGQRAVDLTPGQPAFMDTLALALVAEKRVGEALQLQKQAVQLAPADNGLHLNLAKIALQANDKALARSELERLRALGSAFKDQDKVAALMKTL